MRLWNAGYVESCTTMEKVHSVECRCPFGIQGRDDVKHAWMSDNVRTIQSLSSPMSSHDDHCISTVCTCGRHKLCKPVHLAEGKIESRTGQDR
jgi:hypothetical protein